MMKSKNQINIAFITIFIALIMQLMRWLFVSYRAKSSGLLFSLVYVTGQCNFQKLWT